jgi:biotin carboxyl carrier protein
MTSANGVLCACAVRDRDRILVWQNGRSFEFSKPSAVDDSPESEGFSKNELHAPMPGTLIKLNVTAGDAVIAGQTVAVVEAMKMEHNLRAPRTGVVAKVNAKVGEIVGTDTALVVLASEE